MVVLFLSYSQLVPTSLIGRLLLDIMSNSALLKMLPNIHEPLVTTTMKYELQK